MALIADYFVKTSRYKDEYGEKTILLMQVGAFFEVYGKQNPINKEIYGSEIVEFANVCDLNIVEKKSRIGSDEVLMAGFKDIYIEKYVKRLQDAGFTIPVYVQDENCPNTDRSLYQIYSPGTYFNEDPTKITNTITCVWFNVIENTSLYSKLRTTTRKKTTRTSASASVNTSTSRNSLKAKTTYKETNLENSDSYMDTSSPEFDFGNNSVCSEDTSDVISVFSANRSVTSNGSRKSVMSRFSDLSESIKPTKASSEKLHKMIYIGIASIDIFTGTSTIFEYNEQYIHNNPTPFDELDRIISINCPSEVILIGNISLDEFDNIIHYANIQCDVIHTIPLTESDTGTQVVQKERAQNCERQIYQKAILEKYYPTTDYNSFSFNFNENVIATQSFCYLLDFIYQHNPYLLNKISEPVFESHTNRLLLANHTLKQLNIIDDNNYTGKHSSVAKMLNNTITTMGKRKFAHTLLSPIINEDQLNIEYDMTEYLLENEQNVPQDLMSFAKMRTSTQRNDYGSPKSHTPYTCYDTIKTMLVDIKDLTKYMRQIIIKKISPKAFYQMYKNMQVIVELCNCVKLDKVVSEYLLYHHIDSEAVIEHCNVIMQYFESHFCLEICKSMDSYQNFECNFVNKGISHELDTKLELMNESDDMLQACKCFFNDILHKYEKNTKHSEYIKIHETEKTNFTLVSTKRRCKILQSALAQMCPAGSAKVNYMSTSNGCMKEFTLNAKVDIADGTASNDCITNPQIKELCKNISSAKLSLKDIINKVYIEIVGNTSLILPRLEEITNLVSTIDIIYAKMMIAKKYNFCKPTIVGSATKSFMNVKGLRHCLIEQLNTNELYVANDISLGQNTDGILLYGTNAVGKTSFIRAIGVAIILAQAGLYVPATEFYYKPYHSIFTRIIGNDNIFKGLSTFAVEMTELRNILRLMNQNSLILGDELCSGTESVSAVSIFVAGIQRMHSVQSSFIFATHLHEIVNYEEIEAMTSVQMKHMEVIYDKEKDVLIYDRKLKDGPGQSMYGLEVCKSLNLPADFLQSAYEIRLKYHPETNSVMDSKTSHFSRRKIKSALCEICKKEAGAEIHHLQHQQDANEADMIINDGYAFHKNHPANLVTVCEKCHNKFHDSDKQHVRVKTSGGTIIQELYK